MIQRPTITFWLFFDKFYKNIRCIFDRCLKGIKNVKNIFDSCYGNVKNNIFADFRHMSINVKNDSLTDF